MDTLKRREDKKISNRTEETDIKRALIDIKKMQAGYITEQKKKDLENLKNKQITLNNEIKELEQDANNTFEKELEQTEKKVAKSKLWGAKYKDRNELYKKMGEEKAELKTRMQNLLKQKDEISNKLSNNPYQMENAPLQPLRAHSSQERFHNDNKTRNTSFLHAGADILNRSTPLVSENNIRENQARIESLIRDRHKTLQQFDEQADLTKDEFENDFANNEFEPQFFDGVKDYSNQIYKTPTVDFTQKQRHLRNIRENLENPYGQFHNPEYDRKKKQYEKKRSSLNIIIRDEQNKNEASKRKPKIDNILNDLKPSTRLNTYKKIDLKADSRIDSHRSRNNSTNQSYIKPKLNTIDATYNDANSSFFLPDVRYFKQNIDRPSDMEVEERAVMNIYAQDFDDLKLLGMLNKNPDLYQHKLKQYRDMSEKRFEVEKVLQKQRLDKIKHDYDKQKYEEERQLEYDKWLENENKNVIKARIKKNIVEGKNGNMLNMKILGSKKFHNIKSDLRYDSSEGFTVHFDSVINLPRSQFYQIKVAYGIFNLDDMIVGNKKHIIKDIDPNPLTNIIFELQVPGRDNTYQAISWTLINLFTFKTLNLNSGIFKLPTYQLPTDPTLHLSHIKSELNPTGIYLLIRISNFGDKISQLNTINRIAQYKIPKVHQGGDGERDQRRPQVNDQPEPMKRRQLRYEPENERPEYDSSYSTDGMVVYLHYLKNFNPKLAKDIQIQTSLFIGDKVVSDDEGYAMDWPSNAISVSSIVGQDPTGLQKMKEINAHEMIGTRNTVLPILDNTTWIRDLYQMLWNDKLRNDLFLRVFIYYDTEENPIGSATLKINNDDGSIKYGAFDLPLFKHIPSTGEEDMSYPLGYDLAIILNIPKTVSAVHKPPPASAKQFVKSMMPSEKPKALDTFDKNDLFENEPRMNFDPDDNEEEKIDTSSHHSKKSNKPKGTPSLDPFIVNTLKQHDDVKFDEYDVLVFYVDSGRFLPENISLSRVSVRTIIDSGNVVMPLESATCALDVSTTENPIFGYRVEISKKKFRNLNPSAIMIIRVDTVDRVTLLQKVAGYAFFPLFLDRATNEPSKNDISSDYCLNNGCHQIPLYGQIPKVDTPITFDKLTQLERIPCATLLVR